MTDTISGESQNQTLAAKPPTKISALIFGVNGSGKTLLASSISELGKTAYIALMGESGWQSVPLEYRKSMTPYFIDNIGKLDDLYDFFERGEHDFDAVVIETVTAVQDNFHRYLLRDSSTKIRASAAKDVRTPTQPEWFKIGAYLQDHCWYWYGLIEQDVTPRPIHVIMTCQATFKEDPLGAERVLPDVSPMSRKNVTSTPDHILYTFTADSTTGGDESVHRVRLKNSPTIGAKIHTDISRIDSIPAVLPEEGQSGRLTLRKFAKLIGAI
jgi:hypothetical protein